MNSAHFSRAALHLETSRMISPKRFSVSMTEWQADGAELTQLRQALIVVKHTVPPETCGDDIDTDTERCRHAVAHDAAGVIIGTGRIVFDGHTPCIGFMAVRKDWRGRGVGTALLATLCEEARRSGFARVSVHAQTRAAPFYYRHGFLSYGPEFFQDGIPHQEMRRRLDKAQ